MPKLRFTFHDTSALRAEELAESLEGWLADVEPRGAARRESSSPGAQSAGDVVVFLMQTVVTGVVAGVSQVTVQEIYNQLRIGQWRDSNGDPEVSIEVIQDEPSAGSEQAAPESGSPE